MLPSPLSRLVLILAAAVAAVALVSAAAPPAAQAGSGGVAIDGGAGDTSTKKKRGERRYARIWRNKVSRREKRWARRTAECESGGDPDAVGGGGKYRGAFQFMKATWRNSPKSPGGDPIDYAYRTQAVVAVALKRRDGAGHWPNCG